MKKATTTQIFMKVQKTKVKEKICKHTKAKGIFKSAPVSLMVHLHRLLSNTKLMMIQ
jgi:hypothetical protein